jgi:biopolymer transport protein ExbD
MAMGSSGGGEGLSSEINVTPLIDVLLVLLIIFMITQPLSRKAFDVQVPPQQQSKQKQQQSSQIVLELKADGSYAVNGQPYNLNQLDQAFHQIYDPRPAKLLFIKAGTRRVYQDVIEAMDVARGAGVQIIGFTPKEADKKQ